MAGEEQRKRCQQQVPEGLRVVQKGMKGAAQIEVQSRGQPAQASEGRCLQLLGLAEKGG